MNAILSWALAAAALLAGYVSYGWGGVALAVSVIVFWLLLQFSRAMRAMRLASEAPVGHVPSAVMLHAKLQTGMRLVDVIKLTRSLGRRLSEDPEVFAWRDDSGAEVEIEFVDGQCQRWELKRPPA